MVDNPRHRWLNATRGGAILSKSAQETEKPFTAEAESTAQPSHEPATGVHLQRCNTIDTNLIRAAVDVIFLDQDLRVVKAIQDVERWDAMPEYANARSALELPAGTIARTQTQMGDLLECDPDVDSPPQPGFTLEPLECPQCAGQVPLSDDVSTTCPYCHAQVPIPAEYHALRMAAWRSAADHERVTAAYAELGRPPGALLRAWAGVATGIVGVLWWFLTGFLQVWNTLLTTMFDLSSDLHDVGIVVVVIVGPGLLLALLLGEAFKLLGYAVHAAAVPLHVDLLAVYSPSTVYAMLGLIAYLIFAVPLVLYRFGEAFAQVRHRLQSSLAAKPRQTPGGPALCRNCGAPLNVPVGALGTRCDYCHADNLVSMPEDWVEAVEASERMAHLQIWQAIDEEKQVRKRASRELCKGLLLSLAVIPVFAYGGYVTYLAGWIRR